MRAGSSVFSRTASSSPPPTSPRASPRPRGPGDGTGDPTARPRELHEPPRISLEETVPALDGEPRTGYELSFPLFGGELKPASRRFAIAETVSHAEPLAP